MPIGKITESECDGYVVGRDYSVKMMEPRLVLV